MAMTTYVLLSSRHLAYRIAYGDSAFLLRCNYYISLYVRRHFISVFTAMFRHYVARSLIPVDDYVRIRYFPSGIFILCLYIGLNHFFYGIDLVHIYNTLLG